MTRETADTRDAPVQTRTLRLKGARQRFDWVQQAHRWTTIVQCDERRTILLNHEAKIFAVEPVETPAEAARRIRRTRKIVSPIDTSGGDLRSYWDVVVAWTSACSAEANLMNQADGKSPRLRGFQSAL